MDIRKYKVISASILKNMGADIELLSPPNADQELFHFIRKKTSQQLLGRKLAGPLSRW